MFDATSPSHLRSELSTFASPEMAAGNPSDKDLQRAEGSGLILLSGSDKGARIVDVFQRSPVHIRFPGSGGGAIEEAVFLNTAGGTGFRMSHVIDDDAGLLPGQFKHDRLANRCGSLRIPQAWSGGGTAPGWPGAVHVGRAPDIEPCPASCSMRLATSPVQPVWWEAPQPRPLSPWKYSWKRI
jgi:hypothetical protein